jgi:hypothetical protein
MAQKDLRNLLLALFAVGFGLTACYPEGPTNAADYDITFVRKQPGTDFTQYSTYGIIDTIIYVRNTDDPYDPITPSQQSSILSTVRTNMNNYGYTEAMPNDTPDLAMFVQILVSEESGIYWWDYWGGWWGGWYPWYPCYYPYCGGGGWYTYDYEKGTLAIEMIDVNSYNPSDSSVAVVWGSVSNGILSSSTNTNINLAQEAINLGFELSPYLDIN